MSKYNYAYKCRDCGTELGLKQRRGAGVKRPRQKCPHCGSEETEDLESSGHRRSKKLEPAPRLTRYVVVGGTLAVIGAGLIVVLVRQF